MDSDEEIMQRDATRSGDAEDFSEEGSANDNSNDDAQDGDDQDDSQEEDDNTIPHENTDLSESTIIKATPELASLTNPNVREISHEATWSLSSSKTGNGIRELMDSNFDTYWQSDGVHPHLINIHFSKRKAVSEVAFYLDYTLDESYTPKRIGIKSGVTFHDLVEVKVIEMKEPCGWVSVPLHAEIDPLDDDLDQPEEDLEAKEKRVKKKPLRTHFIQMCVLSMAQNGRDTHIRQVKIFGPKSNHDTGPMKSPTNMFPLGLPAFKSVGLSQFSSIR